MALPALFANRLSVPVVGAPMFIVSYPELVHAQCAAGVAGTFPTLNARTIETLDQWLDQLTRGLAEVATANPGRPVAPFGVNLVMHKTNVRLAEDLALVERYKVPLVITSVGQPTDVVERVHAYGGVVFHDVTNVKHAKKAAEAGVDGLILVAAGAGGHAGTLSPFALLPEVRDWFSGTLLLAGSISSGRAIRAAQVLGADLAYLGTRFIATREAHAAEGYKQMIVGSAAADLVYTSAFSGVPANYMRASIAANGLDPDNLRPKPAGAQPDLLGTNSGDGPKPWKDLWSAGQGIGQIRDVPDVATVVERLVAEYRAASNAA